MKKPFSFRLVFKLTAPIVLIVVIVFMGLMPYVLFINTRILERNMNEQLSHLALTLDSYVKEEVGDLQRSLKLLIDMPVAKAALRTSNSQELTKLLLPTKISLGLDFIAVIDQRKKPTLLFHNPNINIEELIKLDLVEKGLLGLNLSSIHIINDKLYAVSVVSTNIWDEPNIIIAMRALKTPSMMNVEEHLGTNYIVFYDLKGNVAVPALTGNVQHDTLSPDIIDRIIKERKTLSYRASDPTGMQYITLYGPIEFNNKVNAIYGIHIPASAVLSGRNKIVFTMLVLMVAGILLVILTGYITSKWVSRRIGNLLLGTREIASGKLGYQLDVTGTDEISELTASFNEMSTNLKESHDWWKHTFDSMSDAVSVHDAEGNIIKVNSSLVRLVGLPEKEVVGKHCHEIFHETGLSAKDCPRIKSLLSRKPEEIEVFESRLGRWLSISTSPIFNGNGKSNNIIHVVRDITERKRTEELIQLQLKRLNVLHSIEKAVNSSLDLRATLDHLVDQFTNSLGIDAATVLLFNPGTQMLKYVVSRGFRSGTIKHTHLRLSESMAGKAVGEQRIISVPDISSGDEFIVPYEGFIYEGFVSYLAIPLIARGEVKGVLELFHRSSLNPDSEWLDFLDTIADQAAIAIDNAAMFDDLQRSRNELMLAYDSTIVGWSHALDMRDKETEGHSRRVTEMTVQIAEMLGVGGAELMHIRRGALLHDIGKMGIPDSVLLKPGKLTDEEWEIMKRHPDYAREMLSEIDYLKPAIDIPYCHHEKWDGTGYPRGLKGKEIPLAARIFAVVDVWDALSSDRPYRPAWPEKKILEYIRSQAGIHFDPEVVEFFLSLRRNDSRNFGKIRE